MKISARNTLPGIVRRIEEAAVIAEVTLEITPDIRIVSVVTLDALRSPRAETG